MPIAGRQALRWGAALALLPLLPPPVAAQEEARAVPGRPVELQAGRIRTGQFDYAILLQGHRLGEFSISARQREDGAYEVRERASGAAGSQRGVYAFTHRLVPISVDQEGSLGSLTAELHLRYEEGRVRGSGRLPVDEEAPEEGGPGEPRVEAVAVDTAVGAGTLDGQMALAAVLASPLEEGFRLEVPVFGPRTGVTTLVARVVGEASVEVPAGTFRTYRVEVASEESRFVVHVTRDAPRWMVKQELGGGPVSIELVSIGG